MKKHDKNEKDEKAGESHSPEKHEHRSKLARLFKHQKKDKSKKDDKAEREKSPHSSGGSTTHLSPQSSAHKVAPVEKTPSSHSASAKEPKDGRRISPAQASKTKVQDGNNPPTPVVEEPRRPSSSKEPSTNLKAAQDGTFTVKLIIPKRQRKNETSDRAAGQDEHGAENFTDTRRYPEEKSSSVRMLGRVRTSPKPTKDKQGLEHTLNPLPVFSDHRQISHTEILGTEPHDSSHVKGAKKDFDLVNLILGMVKRMEHREKEQITLEVDFKRIEGDIEIIKHKCHQADHELRGICGRIKRLQSSQAECCPPNHVSRCCGRKKHNQHENSPGGCRSHSGCSRSTSPTPNESHLELRHLSSGGACASKHCHRSHRHAHQHDCHKLHHPDAEHGHPGDVHQVHGSKTCHIEHQARSCHGSDRHCHRRRHSCHCHQVKPRHESLPKLMHDLRQDVVVRFDQLLALKCRLKEAEFQRLRKLQHYSAVFKQQLSAICKGITMVLVEAEPSRSITMHPVVCCFVLATQGMKKYVVDNTLLKVKAENRRLCDEIEEMKELRNQAWRNLRAALQGAQRNCIRQDLFNQFHAQSV